jgi:hypothetical protein
MVSSQMQQPQRASGEKATVGRLFLLDGSRQDFLEIVRANRSGCYSIIQKEREMT